MSSPHTDPFSDQEVQELSRKFANAAALRGGLAGIRWLLLRAAGPASARAGIAGRAYNYGIRPLRAVLLPNLGRVGNRIRLGAAAYSSGQMLSGADLEFQKNRQRLLLAAKGATPEMRKLIEDRSTRLGAVGAAFRAAAGLSKGAPRVQQLADDVAKEAVTGAIQGGLKKHKDKVFSGGTFSSWLNPIGSRALATATSAIAGDKKPMMEYAAQFGSKYKDLLGKAQASLPGIGQPKK